jgi:hypothetical protein
MAKISEKILSSYAEIFERKKLSSTLASLFNIMLSL